ncbi:MAG: Heme exporter protein B [Alphaproteobacteria bacterium MarineAlpha5_Bin11]|nr:hypothetical protein [Pelagibacteraceae bacterium]PPR44656.1 MAG: Heme exporter protein B [Alphaproteobacteria bacterium MarineAlpha5_Bin11]PPR51206.1 MAG: Heme exporter protein B [Alphaproteobacteria bacterium MarineAlpha5_Bin10]|tara:strand:- start:5402 stop:6094 length:693 start_codon:yes stop_codon:yes gene_type:complete
MSQIKKINIFILSIVSIAIRDLLIQYRKLVDIVSLLTFFIIVMLIFIFSIGPYDEKLKDIGVSIIWSILILSSTISTNKSLREDFDDGSFAVYQFAGLSYEFIAIIKIITSWILYQLPLIIFIPLTTIIFEMPIQKIYMLVVTMLIGSPILTVFSLIASAMMLTNKKNLTIGSLIILPISVPVIIFAVGAINADPEIYKAQLYILTSILLASFAIGPWIISSCIKISVKS